MKESKYNVLIYSDRKYFILKNLNSHRALNFQECLYNLSVFSYDAVLIYIDESSADIIRIVSAIRKISYVPLLVVMNTEINQIKEIIYAGCDSVMEQNTDTERISIQLWTLARRYRQWIKEKPKADAITEGKLTISKKKHSVKWNSIEVHLTRQEHNFLYLLASSPRRIYTFEQIYQLVWKDYPVGDIKNIIWCLVKRLRKKLNVVEDGAGNCIVSVRDIGYKFELNNENEKQ